MERELKAKLDEAIAGAIDWHERRAKPESIDSRSESKDSKVESIDSKATSIDAEPKALRLARSVKTKLEKLGIWTEVQSQLALDAISAGVQRELDKIKRAAIDAAQMTLPGYEFLPTRIGKRAIVSPDAKVKHFLAHVKRLKLRDAAVTAEHQKQFELADRFEMSMRVMPDMSIAEAVRKLEEKPAIALVKSASTS